MARLLPGLSTQLGDRPKQAWNIPLSKLQIMTCFALTSTRRIGNLAMRNINKQHEELLLFRIQTVRYCNQHYISCCAAVDCYPITFYLTPTQMIELCSTDSLLSSLIAFVCLYQDSCTCGGLASLTASKRGQHMAVLRDSGGGYLQRGE